MMEGDVTYMAGANLIIHSPNPDLFPALHHPDGTKSLECSREHGRRRFEKLDRFSYLLAARNAGMVERWNGGASYSSIPKTCLSHCSPLFRRGFAKIAPWCNPAALENQEAGSSIRRKS